MCWIIAVLFLGLPALSPGQAPPTPPQPVSGHAPARSTWNLKVIEQASNFKRLRVNLRIAHVARTRPVQATPEKPLATVYLKTGMTRK